jgi:hypothetical protein
MAQDDPTVGSDPDCRVAVENDRRGGLAFPALELLGLGGRVLVARDEDEPRPVGRPGVGADAALVVGELPSLAAPPVEEPDLAAALLLLLGAAGGDEGQVAAVRAPARRFPVRLESSAGSASSALTIQMSVSRLSFSTSTVVRV